MSSMSSMSEHDNPDSAHFRNMPAAVRRVAAALAVLAEEAGCEELFGHDVTRGLTVPQRRRLDDARSQVAGKLLKWAGGEAGA
jgi:hypothetical protein